MTDDTRTTGTWDNTRRILKLPTLETQLFSWLRQVDTRSFSRCMDLKRGGSTLYVRKSVRTLAGMGDATCLDVANIALNPKIRGRGWFTAFLGVIDAVNPWDATYIEAVRNPRLASFLPKHGFLELPHENFYLPSKRWRERHGWSAEAEDAAKRLIQEHWPKPFLLDFDFNS